MGSGHELTDIVTELFPNLLSDLEQYLGNDNSHRLIWCADTAHLKMHPRKTLFDLYKPESDILLNENYQQRMRLASSLLTR